MYDSVLTNNFDFASLLMNLLVLVFINIQSNDTPSHCGGTFSISSRKSTLLQNNIKIKDLPSNLYFYAINSAHYLYNSCFLYKKSTLEELNGSISIKKMEEVGKHRHEKVGRGIHHSFKIIILKRVYQVDIIKSKSKIFSSYIVQAKNYDFIGRTIIVNDSQ